MSENHRCTTYISSMVNIQNIREFETIIINKSTGVFARRKIEMSVVHPLWVWSCVSKVENSKLLSAESY